MLEHIWNPWHGCKKYSSGCKYCYMYYLDSKRGLDGSNIYKSKTNFNLPLKKDKNNNYKIPSGTLIHVCMTSDFFLDLADEWRKEAFEIIKKRSDVDFWLQTKRANRVKECLPDNVESDFKNIIICFSCENQETVDKRVPILLDLPIERKVIMCAPMIGKITLEKYLSTHKIMKVIVDGENYEGKRPLHYEWVKSLYEECKKYDVSFEFVGTGNVFVKNNKEYHIVKAYHGVMARRSHLQYPDNNYNLKIQPRCKNCSRNSSCNGCSWCNKCIKK